MKDKPMRCISVAEDARRYFAEEPYTGEISHQLHKVGSLLGVLEAAVKYDEGKDEMLVIPVAEMAGLLRGAMEVKERK